jgi:Bacterial PH domain
VSAVQPPGPADRPAPPAAVPSAVPAPPAAPPDVYRSSVSLVVWWVWVAFAAINLVDLAVQGRDHFAAVVAAALVLITGVTYVAAFRPRVSADDEAVTITNPLRGHRVPWSCVESMELGDSLEVHCRWQDGGARHKKLYIWAVHSPRRSRLKAQMRARRKMSAAERRSESFGRLPPEARAAMAKTDAEHILESLRARAGRARAAGVPEASTAGGGPVSRWDLLAVAALLVPAALLAVLALT